jgi:hypothetical protein
MFSYRSLSRGITAGGRRFVGSLVLILGLLVMAPGVVLGQEAAEPATTGFAGEVEEHFEVLPLREGLLLQPRDPDLGFRALELVGNDLVIDGVSVSASELRDRLGDVAEAVLSLSALDGSERAALFDESQEIEVAASDLDSEGESEERRKRRRRVNRSDANVVVGSSVTIEEDEVARDVVVIGGPLTIRGKVIGDAVAVGGAVEVSGEVTGDVAAVGASLELEDGARVLGDAISVGGAVEQHSGAEVLGRVSEVPFLPSLRFGHWGDLVHGSWDGPDVDVDVDFSPFPTITQVMWDLFGLGVLLLFACLTLLVARNPVERVGEKAAEEPWKSGLVGLLGQILFFPLLILVVLILVVSIVGIPFLLLLPFAIVGLILVGLLGYTAVAYRVGRWSESRFGWRLGGPFIALLVGVGFIQVWSVIGSILSMGPGPVKFFAVMFALFGGLLCYAVWTLGFGAALLTRFGTSPTWAGGEMVPAEPDFEPAGEGWEVPLDETPALESPIEDESPSDWEESRPEEPRED